MSRASRNSTGGIAPRRAVMASLGIALAALLGAAGCGAGQVTQTDSMLPAVNGALGSAGPIAIRNAALAYPEGGRYRSGGEAELLATIVNTGATDDELVEASSPVAGSVRLTGDQTVPAGHVLSAGPVEQTHSAATPTVTPSAAAPPATAPPSAPSGPASAQPTSSEPVDQEPPAIGTLRIVLTGLTADVMVGKTVEVTFVFRNAGSVTVAIPVAAPATARPEPTDEGGESHG